MLSPKIKPFGMNSFANHLCPSSVSVHMHMSGISSSWHLKFPLIRLVSLARPPPAPQLVRLVSLVWQKFSNGRRRVHVSVYSTRSGSTGTLPTIVRACYAILVPQIMMLFRPNQFHHWLQISRTWKALKMEGDGDQRANHHHSPLNRKISFPKVSPIECLTFNNLGLHNNEWHHPNIVHQIPE